MFAFLASVAASAADPAGSFSFRSYGPDQGLFNQAVTSLAQDRLGFLYAGTEDGLYRFDGERFQRFGVADGLPADAVTLLHATARGQLWVATQKGLVAWHDDGNRAGSPAALVGKEVIGMASAADGALVVATSTGFFEATPTRPDFVPLAGVPAKAGAAWISHDGDSVLLAVDGRLYLRAGGAWRTRQLPAAQASQAVQSIVRDRRGRFWMRGRQMLFRIDGFDGPIEDLGAQLPGAAVQKGELGLDRAGRVWAPSNHGIACFDGDRRLLIDVAHGLPHEWATTLMQDREGSLWVASEGVHRLLGRMAWTSYSNRQGLPSDTVWAEFRDRAGTLWAATNSGVARGTANGWLPLPEGRQRSFYAFAESPAGDLWIGGNTGQAKGNTLLLRRAGSARFELVPLRSALGSSTVNSLGFGKDGALYVATMAHGVHRIVPEGAGYRSERVAVPGGAANEQVNQLARGSDGRLWGAGMQGLLMFDGSTWRRFTTRDGLVEDEIETVAAAGADGSVWLSYWNEKGLGRVRIAANGALGAMPVRAPAELVADTIYSSGSNRAGELWLGTARGIKRWRGGRVERFGRGDGLPGDDAAANAFWGDDNGDAWLGMANGLARYDASLDLRPVPAPATQVTDLRDGASKSLAGATPSVPWQRRALTFDFATLSFIDPPQLQRQVRLLGFEGQWRDTGVGEARYTGLPPGRYTFQVRARLAGGAFGPVASRSVVVLPPWWLTWWFGLLSLAAAVLLSRALLRWKTAALSRRNQQLEAIIAERTRDLQAANAALEESNMLDPLTGLKNRRYLQAFMPGEVAQSLRLNRSVPRDTDRRGHNIDLCLLLVDLDHFKSVNDTHGHAAGDAVLRQVSAVLQSACRSSDVVVRWGGEEFLLLARNADRQLARVLAGQVCAAVRAHPFDLGNGVVLRKTCSLGFTAFPLVPAQPERFGWEQAVELADRCLYAAKHSGRDGWVGACLLDPSAPPDPDSLVLPGFGPAHIVTSFADVGALRWKA